MTKTCKNVLLTVILALLFATFTCLLVACDEPEEQQPLNYTVTVLTGENSPASGVQVKIRKGGAIFGTPQNTDANGKAEFELAGDDYTVELDNLPQYYSIPEDADLTLSATKTSVTITLEKAFLYTVKLVKSNGQPYYAQGVTVGVCTVEGECLEAVDLGTNGVAVIKADAGNYHVKVYNLPVNASIAVDDDGYYEGEDFTAAKNEMTITVTEYEILSVNSLTAMTDKEKEDLEADNDFYYSKNENVSYHVSKEIPAGEVAYFSLTAEITGDYAIAKDSSLIILSNGTEFASDKNGQSLFNTLSCEKGKTYYFKIVNPNEKSENPEENKQNAINVEFVVMVPFSSSIDHSGQGGILDVTVGKELTNALIDFQPTVTGEYKITVTGAPAIVVASQMSQDQVITESPAADAYKENASVTYMVYTSQAGATVHIAITAKADKYPVDLHVTIEKTKDVEDNNTVKPVQATLSQFPNAEEGKVLVGVPMNGNVNLTEENGIFLYDGKVVVVNIIGNLDESRLRTGGKLAYLELATYSTASYKAITQNDNGETVVDWSVFIRGFSEYEYDKLGTPYIPETIETETYYANFVNEDGVYPLTAELKQFLETFCQINQYLIAQNVPNGTPAQNQWLFPCYYYDKAAEDDIIGEYNIASYTDADNVTFKVGEAGTQGTILDGGFIDGKLDANSCILSINADNTWQLTTYSYDPETEAFAVSEEYNSGTWSNVNGTYTFTDSYGDTLTYSNGVFTYTAPYTCTIILGEEVDPIVGDHAIASFTDTDKEPNETFKVGDTVTSQGTFLENGLVDGKLDAKTCLLQINKDNTWKILIWNNEEGKYADEEGYDNGTWTNNNGTYTFVATYGQLTYANGAFTYTDMGVLVFGEEIDPVVGDYSIASVTDLDKEPNVKFEVGDTVTSQGLFVEEGLVDGKLDAKTCLLQINKDNTWKLLTWNTEEGKYSELEYDFGLWENEDGEYLFISNYDAELTYSNGVFTYTEDGSCSVVFGEAPAQSESGNENEGGENA